MSDGLQHGHWKNFTTASGGRGEKNQLCDQNWQDKTIDGGGAGQSRQSGPMQILKIIGLWYKIALISQIYSSDCGQISIFLST